MRAEICVGLEYLAITLDVAANRDNAEVISDRSARCVVRVVATDEDLIIVRHIRDAIFRVSKKIS